MSRHRNVRNLTEEDYYDYDDDYYDEEDYYEEDETYSYSYSQQKQQQQQQHYAPPARAAASTSTSTGTGTSTSVAAGVSKPPPGWGKPAAPKSASVSLPAASSTPAPAPAPGGIAKPPQGWGKPTKTTSVSSGASGISSPPAGWGKPAIAATRSTSPTPPTSNQKSNKAKSKAADAIITPAPYTPKPMPDALSKATTTRSQLSMVVLGHVDAGKSTLMGQLLVQVGKVSKRDAQKAQNISWLLDEKESERERGVTMEIATKGFALQKHDVIILDAPGHADFIPIMITGAANADVCILVIAAVTGEFEAGFDRGGQTKEHILLARGLGVSQVIVAINKLDVEGWSKTRYDEIQTKVLAYLKQQQFKPNRIRFVPLSGLTGENVQTAKDDTLKTWYKGPTLLEAIDNFQPANRQIEKPLRFIVTDVFAEGKGVTTRGRVVQGFLQVGERIVLLPIGDSATVNKLEHLQPPSDVTDSRRLAIAMAGDTVELVLQGIDIMRVSVGSILCNANARPPLAKKFQTKILVMDQLTVPIIRGAQVLFHMHSLDVPAVMNKLIATTKRDGSIKKERPRALPGGSSAIVELTLSDKLALEPFADCRALGRFVLRRGGDTIAVGVIDKLVA